MSDPKNEDFLDDIAAAEAEELAEDMAEIDDAVLDNEALRAERDEMKDRWMRA
ncbi:MAG: nucleotide exchange factor GrpE, partial [Marinovum sp.]|nr:nucleotide exchange factor GrpE [Marinovum sp.]